MNHGNILKSKKWPKSGMTKHIFRSTETPTPSLKSGKIHKRELWGLPNISRVIPKSRNGRERREVGISITTGDFNVTGKDSNWGRSHKQHCHGSKWGTIGSSDRMSNPFRYDVISLLHRDALGPSGVHAWTMPCNLLPSFLPSTGQTESEKRVDSWPRCSMINRRSSWIAHNSRVWGMA
jgi:hypothetical protein